VVQGEVHCWGDPTGQLSLGGPSTSAAFNTRKVMGLTGATAVAMNPYATCALLQGGGLKCWGQGPFVSGSSSATPQDIMGATSNIAGLHAGPYGFCVRNDMGSVRCWGGTSQLQDVMGLGAASSVGVASSHKCALLQGTGELRCWGSNYYGELGTGTGVSSSTPVTPFGLGMGVSALGVGLDYSCVLMANTGLKCWGRNTGGQLGNGQATTSFAARPDDVAGLSGATGGVTSLLVGSGFACARLTSGAVKCWGDDHSGSITPDLQRSHAVPVDYAALSNLAQLASARDFACALSTDGTVSCWGANGAGQLGHPSFWTLPQEVGF
jgi:alpha-tubulin suppressor-like RCC1 family protein